MSWRGPAEDRAVKRIRQVSRIDLIGTSDSRLRLDEGSDVQIYNEDTIGKTDY